MIVYPKGTERALARHLVARTQAIRDHLLPRVEALLRRPGVRPSDVATLIEATRRAVATFAAPEVTPLFNVAAGVEGSTTRALLSMVQKATGQDLTQDARLRMSQIHAETARAEWAQNMLAWQQRIEREMFDRLQQKVDKALQTGSVAQVLETATAQVDQAEGRLRLLARNELGHLVERVTETRSRALGIESYTWWSERDELVRPLHKKLHGTVRRWDDPHPTEGHPGQTWGCRCTPQPRVEEVAAPKAAPAPKPTPKPTASPPPKPSPVPVRTPQRRRPAHTPPAPVPPPAAPPAPPPNPPPAPAPPPSAPSFDLSKLRARRGEFVDLFGDMPSEARDRELQRIFGRQVTPSEILDWVGVAQDDIDEAKSITMRFEGDEVQLTVVTPKFKAERKYKRSRVDGQLIAEHESLEVFETGKGLGARLFGRQVSALRRAGFGRIDTFAAGSYGDPEYNGYWTWAAFGFDAKLPNRIASKLPPELAEAKSVSDLMSTAEGQQWWKVNGKGLDMNFDLDPQSRSSQKLDIYLTSKGIRRDAEEIDLDAEDERLLLEAALEQARREKARREEAERKREPSA